MAKGKSLRTPGSGENVGVLSFDDIIEGDTSLKLQQASIASGMLQLIKVAQQDTTVNRDYPYDGDGILDAVNNGTPSVTLDASGVPSWLAAEGLLVVITNGTAIGEVRRIISYVSATRVATLNRVYSSAPSAGDTYVVLIDCLRFNTLFVKTEFSSSSAAANLGMSLALYDFPRTSAGTPANRAPIRFRDVERVIDDTADNVVPSESGYYHGTTISVAVPGILGAKVRVNSISTGSFSIWAGAV